MKAGVHSGEVVHSMDHFVLDLKTREGFSNYLTVYSVGMMRGVGAGLVALMRLSTPEGRHEYCFAEEAGLAHRMQQRLLRIQAEGDPLPGTASVPTLARINREPTSGSTVRWHIKTPEQSVTATWSAPEPAMFVWAPAPRFHVSRDYATVMVSYRQAEIVIDGQSAGGKPYEHDVWAERLDRPFSSCHAAFAETATDPS